MRPIRCRGREHRATSGSGIDAHAAVLVLVFFPDVVGKLVPTQVLFTPLRRSRSKDDEIFGRSVVARGNRASIHQGKFTTIALVPDNGGRATKLLSFLQTGTLEHPVVRAMHLVTSASVKNLAELMEASSQKTDSCELVFRPLDEMVTPQRREQGVPFRSVKWVLPESFLPADKIIAVIFRADLPTTGIAAEKRDVAALSNIVLKVVAHRCGPVFVVPNTKHQFVVLEHLRMKFEVTVDGVVDLVAIAFCPLNEGEFPIPIHPAERSLKAHATPQDISGFMLHIPVS